MKVCKNCQTSYDNENDICPNCGCSSYIIDEKMNMIMSKNKVKDGSDTTMRIEKVPLGGFQSLTEDCKGARVFIIILIVFSLFSFLISSFLIFVLNVELESVGSNQNSISNYIGKVPVIIICTISFIFCVSMAIKLIFLKKRIKKLQKCGVVLKNTPFIIRKNGNLMLVKVEYKDEFGNIHIFKGILPKYAVRNNLCDVIFNQDNYKQYFIRYNIY